MKIDSVKDVRICPYCAEQVRSIAKVCPRCRQWLTAFSLRNPAAMVIIWTFCFYVMLAGFVLGIKRLLDPGVEFSDYRDSISIVESRMSFGKGEDNIPVVNLVLVVTNKSNIPWRVIEFDTRFFNKAGALIDARPYQDWTTILPHDELALRIVAKPLRDIAEYDNCKVYARAARDARSRLY